MTELYLMDQAALDECIMYNRHGSSNVLSTAGLT
jgi:hypothetical protein